jgi:RNase H-fold protein (predicted Holliday junction resolvase)
MDVRGKKRKAVVDAVSAVLILEDYMNSLKV